MMKTFAALSVVLALPLVAGCASNAGFQGRFVNDALPEYATIYAMKYDEHGNRDGTHIPGTEDDRNEDLIDYKWDLDVPCSDITAVTYWADDGEFALALANAIYGNQYIPSLPDGRYWLRPEIWVDGDYESSRSNDFTKQQAQELADHCGVELRIRQN